MIKRKISGTPGYEGYFAENFVAQEFVFAHEEELYCWHEHRAELEFLREMNGEVLPVEVKSGSIVSSKSLKTFVEKYGSKKGVVLSGRNLSVNSKKRFSFTLFI